MSNNYYVTDKYYGNSTPKATGDPVFGIRTIGASKWVDQSSPDPIKAIQGEIWAGAGHIEITAPGTGRGGRGNSTYEEFDKEQRQAIRELVKVNKVNLSVHATPNVQMTGLGREGFSEEQRRRSIEEVKKAIDFSRDASSGGSVVVHTGEFPRPLDAEGWYKDQFQFHPGEKEEARFLLVDKETGQLVQSVKANEVVVVPDYEIDEKTKKPKYLVDEKGNYVYDDVLQEYLLAKYHTKNWNDVPDEEKVEARIKLAKKDELGNIKTKSLSFQEFIAEKEKEGYTRDESLVEFYKQQTYGAVQHQLGQSKHYESNYREGLEKRQEILEQMKKLNDPRSVAEVRRRLTTQAELQKIPNFEELNQDEQLKLLAETQSRVSKMSENDLVPFSAQEELKKLQVRLSDSQRMITYGQETALSGQKQAKELLRRIDKVQDIKEFALDKSKKSFAELGLYAMEQTKAAQKMRPNDNVKDIFVSLENIYPEMGYGSHPEELMKLTDNAREEMAKRLVEQKRAKDQKEAMEIAKKHIKVTFDTGHMNMWRKHFVAQNGRTSKEQMDEDFNKWYKMEVEKMAKGGYIGNVHLADNFGYDDTHLAPGAGSAPIQDVLHILKKHGYNEKMAVEGGFNQGKNGYHETWKMVGAHIDTKYAKGRDGTDAWLNPNSNFRYVRDGYLGVAQRPNFIFKGYSPDSDDWKPWSGLGME